MAIYHLTVKQMSRSKGHSGTAASAYRSGEKVHDDRADLTHDFTSRTGVVHTEILAPEHAPEWATERERLWNEVEMIEKRKDAQVAREVEVALPRDLDHEARIEMVQEFVKDKFVSQGMIADIALHAKDAKDGEDNPHAHIMLTMRNVTADGFGGKNREWNDKALVTDWRQAWETTVNSYLEAAGRDERIDHRTLKEQGIDRTPQQHIGATVNAMEDKGLETHIGNAWREGIHENKVRAYETTVTPAREEDHATLLARMKVHAGEVVETIKDIRDTILEKYAAFKGDSEREHEPEITR